MISNALLIEIIMVVEIGTRRWFGYRCDKGTTVSREFFWDRLLFEN